MNSGKQNIHNTHAHATHTHTHTHTPILYYFTGMGEGVWSHNTVFAALPPPSPSSSCLRFPIGWCSSTLDGYEYEDGPRRAGSNFQVRRKSRFWLEIFFHNLKTTCNPHALCTNLRMFGWFVQRLRALDAGLKYIRMEDIFDSSTTVRICSGWSIHYNYIFRSFFCRWFKDNWWL